MSLGLRPLWLPPGEEAVIGPDGRPLPTPPTDAAPPPLPVDGPPAPPDYQPPDLLSAPPPGFRERLAAALAATPAYQPTRGSTGAQSFFGGLLTGGARGFAASGATKAKAAEAERERTNTVRKAEADRNYANALDTWRAKLRRYYRAKDAPDGSGRMILTAKMVEDARLPKEAIGTPMNPKEFAERRDRVAGVQPSGIPSVTRPPKSAPKPKGPSPTESRRTLVANIIAELTKRGMGDRAGLQAYMRQAGVIDTLASHGLTPADLIRAVPE